MSLSSSSMDADKKPFFRAVLTGDFGAVNTMLESGNYFAGMEDTDGWTAAGRAVQKGRTGVLQVMLDNGLDAKLKGQHGVTLLHVAVSCNKYLIAKMLLQAGADPIARNEMGKSPRDIASDPAMVQLLQDAITEGAPPVRHDNVYEVGEQAYCLDKHGHWWPAIIEAADNGLYAVHFPGYGKRDDVKVSGDQLQKITRDTVRILEAARQEALLRAAAKGSRAASKAAARRSAATGSPALSDDGPASKKAKPEEAFKSASGGALSSKPATPRPSTSRPSIPTPGPGTPSAAAAAASKRRKSATSSSLKKDNLDNLEMAAKLDSVISTLQEQRSMLLTKNLGDGAATEAIAQKDARIEQLKEELAKVVRESESRRTEILKRDTELRKLRDDTKKLKESETAAVAAAKKSAAEVEVKVAEARARAEREMATAARNAPVAQPGRHQSSDEMIRKIAMLNSKSLHLEAENERYKRLYDQIEAEVTKLRKQAKESAAAAAAAVADAAVANAAAASATAKAAADMEKKAEATKVETSAAPAETEEQAASTAEPSLTSNQPVAAPAVETAAPAPATETAAPSAAQVPPEASTTDDLNVDINSVSSDSELVLMPASIEQVHQSEKAADGLSALPMAEP